MFGTLLSALEYYGKQIRLLISESSPSLNNFSMYLYLDIKIDMQHFLKTN